MIPKPESGLPSPDTASATHSKHVTQHLQSLIDATDEGIPFSQFMHEALYSPGLGYYAAGARKFGPAGDFTTAPEISPLYGAVLGRQIAAILDDAAGSILEFGAGTGALTVQLLRKLAELNALPHRYLILEVSPDLVERQQALIASELPELSKLVRWIDLPPDDFRGVIVANEVLDAIPVERFRMDGDCVMRGYVVGQDGRFDWRYVPAPEAIASAVRRIEADIGQALPDGYCSELAPGREAWVKDIAERLAHGTIVLIDYGVSRREYYAPDRNDGWLQCHFRQHVHGNPLILPGIQDITAWVDFTAVANVAVEAGLSVNGYASQGPFLLRGGLDLEFADFTALSETRQATLSGQAKLLTMPGEMGENFKLIALTRGNVEALPAFRDTDRAHTL
jgi:SAM-dependent MidA family methyltransferase